MASNSPAPPFAEPALIPQGDYAGKPALRLHKAVVVAGSTDHCHLHLVSSSVSRQHALIIADADGVYIRDLASRTKVVVNGQPHREALLQNEDEIHIGKFSFRFATPATGALAAMPAPAARITVNGADGPDLSASRTVLIGKGAGCDISLGGESVSTRHAIIFTAKGKRYIRDFDSRTGTFLNGEKIHQHELRIGDQLRIGETAIQLMPMARAAPAETLRPAEPVALPVEPAALPVEPAAEPVAEIPASIPDVLPLAQEPEAAEAPVAEPIELEPVAEAKADAVDEAIAAAKIDVGQDALPVEPEPAASGAMAVSPAAVDPVDLAMSELDLDLGTESEAMPQKLATDRVSAETPLVATESITPSEPTGDPVEMALAEAGIDFENEAEPQEPAPAAEASQPAAVEVPQPAAEMDVVESALDDTAVDPAKDSIPLEPEPAVAVARAPEPEPAAAGAEPEQSSEPPAEKIAAAEAEPTVAVQPARSELDLGLQNDPLDLAIADLKIDFDEASVSSEAPAAVVESSAVEKPEAAPAMDSLDSAIAEAGIDFSGGTTSPEVELPSPAEKIESSEPPPLSLELANMPVEAESVMEIPSPAPVANESAIAEIMPPISPPPVPETPVAEAELPQTPEEIGFDLNLDLPDSGDSPESFEPMIELTPAELGSDEAVETPKPESPASPADEVRADDSPPQEIPAAEEPAEAPRKRPARGRKAAAKTPTKPARTPRAKAKRQPPKTAETLAEAEIPADAEPVVDAEREGKVKSDENSDIAEAVPLSATDEITLDLALPEAVAETPSVSVQPLAPLAMPDSDEAIADAGAAQEVAESPEIPESIEAPTVNIAEPSGEWEMTASASEEISTPIISQEQPVAQDRAISAPVVPFEQSIVDSPPPIAHELAAGGHGDEELSGELPTEAEPMEGDLPAEGGGADDLAAGTLPTGQWTIPPAPVEELSPPVAASDVVLPRAAPTDRPSASPPLRLGMITRIGSHYIAPILSSFGGLGFVGGGSVNIDHFVGGKPITLPELPPTPAGFGRVNYDMSGPPLPSFFRQAPAAGSPPPAAEQPAQPAPAPAREEPAIKPPPPPPQPPPVSFAPRPQRKAGGAIDEQAQYPAPKKRPASTAFDGLAMGENPDEDNFWNNGPTPTNDAAFGGAPMSKTDEFIIPESDPRANRAAETPAKDFAEDEFWNRTDGDTASTAGTGKIEPPEIPPEIPSAALPQNSPPDSSDESPPALKADGIMAEELATQMPMDESGETDLNAVKESQPVAEAERPVKKRRFRIPFLMPIILAITGISLAAVWRFFPVQSQTQGTLTFVNFQYIPGTEESSEFEAAQRRLLGSQTDDQTRRHAMEILGRDDPGTSPGFLASPQSFAPVAASVSLAAATQTVSPQTLLQVSYSGTDKDGDPSRMLALLKSLTDRNATQIDANRRLQADLDQAKSAVDDAQKKLDGINGELASLDPEIAAAPPANELAAMTAKKTAMERNRLDAETAVNRDRADLAQLTSSTPAPTTQPDISADSQLKQMQQQLADLTAEVDSARSDQLASAAMARQKLQAASRQFDEQIDAANTLLGSGSQLRQFVDSAMDSQTKARDLINMLIVDGEDLEQQLEDTRRDVEDLIQSQQAEKWALDPQLQSLRENLESAQHRYNANAGQGVDDPRVLDPIQKEIDSYTTQVKQRQLEIGADPAELHVQDSLNSIIDALRKKLAKEKHQTDEVLDPLQQELANLDPVVAALPAAQQDLAKRLHDRLDELNDARQKYSDTFGDEMLAPSPKVSELKDRIASLKADILARQTDLQRKAIAAQDAQQHQDVADAQVRLQMDQSNLDSATKSLAAVLASYDELHARQVSSESAQQRKINLLDDRSAVYAALESARRDRDEKQSAAEHAYDIKPVTAADVISSAPPDSRTTYYVVIMGAALIAMMLAALASHGQKSEKKRVSTNFDSLVIPMASDEDHAASHG